MWSNDALPIGVIANNEEFVRSKVGTSTIAERLTAGQQDGRWPLQVCAITHNVNSCKRKEERRGVYRLHLQELGWVGRREAVDGSKIASPNADRSLTVCLNDDNISCG